MRKILIVGLTALLLFVLSAVGSWFLRRAQEEAKLVDRVRTPATERPLSLSDLEAEERLQKKELAEADKKREEKLAAQRHRWELILADLKRQKAEVDDLRQKADDEYNKADKKVNEIQEKRDRLKEEQKALDKSKVDLKAAEEPNLKKIAEAVNRMEPPDAAKMFIEMYNKSRKDSAVKILATMGERQAAKVLGEISKTKPSVAEELADAWRRLQKQDGSSTLPK